MPVRIGFVQFRRQMLEQELERMLEVLPILGIEKAILTGDLVSGDFTPTSTIDFVFVHETDRPFGRRADFFLLPYWRAGGDDGAGLYAGGVRRTARHAAGPVPGLQTGEGGF